MTLPTTGAISLADIQTEFGGENPISLDEYYLRGYTTDNNTSVPALSGAISFEDFRGAVKLLGGATTSVAFDIPSGNVTTPISIGDVDDNTYLVSVEGLYGDAILTGVVSFDGAGGTSIKVSTSSYYDGQTTVYYRTAIKYWSIDKSKSNTVLDLVTNYNTTERVAIFYKVTGISDITTLPSVTSNGQQSFSLNVTDSGVGDPSTIFFIAVDKDGGMTSSTTPTLSGSQISPNAKAIFGTVDYTTNGTKTVTLNKVPELCCAVALNFDL